MILAETVTQNMGAAEIVLAIVVISLIGYALVAAVHAGQRQLAQKDRQLDQVDRTLHRVEDKRDAEIELIQAQTTNVLHEAEVREALLPFQARQLRAQALEAEARTRALARRTVRPRPLQLPPDPLDPNYEAIEAQLRALPAPTTRRNPR